MRVIAVYDDTGRKSEVIADIIGEKGFADVVVRKKRLEEYYEDEIRKVYPDISWKRIRSVFEYADLVKEIELYSNDTRILHCFSNYLISDGQKAALSFEKLKYIDRTYAMLENKRAVAAMFPGPAEYIDFCRAVISGQHAWDIVRGFTETFEAEGMVDIGVTGNFIQCVTGNFDSRYFNSLKGNGYTLVKSSSNKEKIRAEYCFYHLLPENMKFWFVIPFDYREEEHSASYTMERLHMTDLAIKWVHGSMDENEFGELMDKYFFFFNSRHTRPCTATEYQEKTDALYVGKVIGRINDLKGLSGYEKIRKMLGASEDMDIDSLVSRYFILKQKIEARVDYSRRLVIGHGDPCFANALYNKSTKTLKFIDPRGALVEEDLWTNEYYDVAKLSHSVCGRYDFFNNGLFEIKVDSTFGFSLEIPFDNSDYIKIFRKKVEANGFDYLTVRIYEVSLFLSMLPLHIDNPHKVFGFILNAKNILEEIEKDV